MECDSANEQLRNRTCAASINLAVRAGSLDGLILLHAIPSSRFRADWRVPSVIRSDKRFHLLANCFRSVPPAASRWLRSFAHRLHKCLVVLGFNFETILR